MIALLTKEYYIKLKQSKIRPIVPIITYNNETNEENKINNQIMEPIIDKICMNNQIKPIEIITKSNEIISKRLSLTLLKKAIENQIIDTSIRKHNEEHKTQSLNENSRVNNVSNNATDYKNKDLS